MAWWLPQGTLLAAAAADKMSAELLDTAASMKGSGWGGGDCHSLVIRARSPQLGCWDVPFSFKTDRSSLISHAAFTAWSP